MFEVNDKAVCIDGKFKPEIAALYAMLPKEGETYVVRDVFIATRHGDGKPRGTVGLLLVGLVNPSGRGGKFERSFDADRFRKPEELASSGGQRRPERVADAVGQEVGA